LGHRASPPRHERLPIGRQIVQPRADQQPRYGAAVLHGQRGRRLQFDVHQAFGAHIVQVPAVAAPDGGGRVGARRRHLEQCLPVQRFHPHRRRVTAHERQPPAVGRHPWIVRLQGLGAFPLEERVHPRGVMRPIPQERGARLVVRGDDDGFAIRDNREPEGEPRQLLEHRGGLAAVHGDGSEFVAPGAPATPRRMGEEGHPSSVRKPGDFADGSIGRDARGHACRRVQDPQVPGEITSLRRSGASFHHRDAPAVGREPRQLYHVDVAQARVSSRRVHQLHVRGCRRDHRAVDQRSAVAQSNRRADAAVGGHSRG
jgi:hypothetical protein